MSVSGSRNRTFLKISWSLNLQAQEIFKKMERFYDVIPGASGPHASLTKDYILSPLISPGTRRTASAITPTWTVGPSKEGKPESEGAILRTSI